MVQEDSAIALTSGNDSMQSLARVLKGRALLALGRYSEAAQTVSTVADSFQYLLAIQWVDPNLSSTTKNRLSLTGTISDREGINGLPYMTGGDARTATTSLGTVQNGTTILYFPKRYSATPGKYTQFPIANGIEARLIEAEAALHAGDTDTWLGILNHLRETARVPTQTAALPDTTDPGTDTARLSLMFRERAYWLFVSGHRQGDLRRLVRVYNRPQNQVYPIGSYTAPGAGTYGSDINIPVPSGEFANPLYHGCLDRDE
jgi:hypothetical protein